MNHAVYIFGELGAGYTQYPDDYTNDLFKSLHQQAHANSQLAVHRDGELMYYAYLRKLTTNSASSQYIGMCCVFNGVYTTHYKELFDIFEKTVASLVVNGDILEFTDKGEITSKIDQLYRVESLFKSFKEYLSAQIDIAFAGVKKLPPINYAVSKSEVKKFSTLDRHQDIVTAIQNYSTVIIAKNKDYDTTTLTSYAAKLKTLSDENDALKKTNLKLEKEKKRTKLVAWLMTILVVLALIFFLVWTNMSDTIDYQTSKINTLIGDIERLKEETNQLNTDLNNKTTELANATRKIKQQECTISEKSDSISYLRNDIQNLNGRLSSVSKDFSNFRKNISKQACIITDVLVANTEYSGEIETNYGGYIRSGSTMFLQPKIIYIGVTAGNKIIYVKLFDSYGTLRSVAGAPSGYSFKEEKDIKLGKQEAYFTGLGGNNKGYWPAGTYRYEFYCDGQCIGTREFTIH